jgi:carbon monoxide dehydrogenase subunit G
MIDVSDTVRVDAPPSAVFAYLDEPRNHVEVTPSLAGVDDIEPLDNGGKRATFTYGIAGVGLDGELVQTEHSPDERMRFDLRGSLPGEIDIRLEPDDGETLVTYAATYEIPGRVLAAVAEPFVRRYNERELRTLLDNLKTRLETGAPGE